MVTAWRAGDAAAAAAKRVADAAAEAAAREAAATKKSESRNAASEIVLWKSVSDMDDALAAVGSAGANKKKALLEQIDARVLRPLFVYQFPVVKGLPKGPLKGIIPEVAHLRDLVGKMILADLASGRDLTAPIPDAAAGPNLKRELPAPAPELRTAQSKAAAASAHAKRAAAAAQDDPELLGLEKKYKNKKFTDVAEHTKGSKKARAPDERFVVLGIAWSTEHDKWVAECVELDKEDEIPDSKKTAGGRVLKEALEYYLCESLDGMLDAPPSSNESDSE